MVGRMSKVVVVGLGYVGLPLAVRAAEVGFSVMGIDVNPCRVRSLLAGRSYVEDVAEDRLTAAVTSGRLSASTNYSAAEAFEVAVITVPTPLADRSPDLSHVENAARALAPRLRPGALVVLESTTYPGTTDTVLRDILETGSGLRAGPDFCLGYSPERIDPGNTRWTLESTPKVVSGIDEKSRIAAVDFYARIVDEVVPVSSTRTAEVTKLLENTFRHVNIALVNELAIVARELDVNVWEVIEAAATKPFGFLRFTPGPGVGGHCLPIDPVYLSWQVERITGQAFRFVELARDVNEGMPAYVVQRVMLALNRQGLPVRGSRVLVLGLAYKRNSSDPRTAPAGVIIDLLGKLGADVAVSDPRVRAADWPPSLARVEASPAEVAAADAVILVTDHDDFDYPMIHQTARLVVDCRNRMSGPNVDLL